MIAPDVTEILRNHSDRLGRLEHDVQLLMASLPAAAPVDPVPSTMTAPAAAPVATAILRLLPMPAEPVAEPVAPVAPPVAVEPPVAEPVPPAAPEPVAEPPAAIAPEPEPAVLAAVATPAEPVAPEPPPPPPEPTVRILHERTIERRAAAAARKAPPLNMEPEPQPFLTEEQAARGVEPPAAPAARSIEEAIGTTWFLRIGGLLMMVGLAWGAMLLEARMTPGMRVFAGYALALAVAAGGRFVQRRNQLVGRGGIALALAIGYFVSFASNYLGHMRIATGQPMLALTGMLACAAGVVMLAERWRSEAVAAFGFLLALIATLLSAPSSQHFALVSLTGLSVASGVLLLRNGWVQLTGLMLAATYAAFGILNALLRWKNVELHVEATLGAIWLQYAVYLAAFMRWSRPWLARERALEEGGEELAVLPQEGGSPFGRAFDGGRIPWGRSFDILNTLGLVGLSLVTVDGSSLWPQVHWLLGALAVVEFLRLVLLRIENRGIPAFHALTAATLAAATAAVGLSGGAAAVVLALQTLVLSVAGSQARSLRWLRPLSAIPASAAVGAIFVGAMSPVAPWGALSFATATLLASSLPFHRWMAAGVWESQYPIMRTVSALSAHYRALVATLLAIVLVLRGAGSSAAAAPFLLLVPLAVTAGLVGARISQWATGAFAATLICSLAILPVPSPDTSYILAVGLQLMMLAALWLRYSLVASREDSTAASFRGVLGLLPALAVAGAWTVLHVRGIGSRLPLGATMPLPVLLLALTHPFALERLRLRESLKSAAIVTGEAFGLLATLLMLGALAARATDTVVLEWGALAAVLVCLGAVKVGAWRVAQFLSLIAVAAAIALPGFPISRPGTVTIPPFAIQVSLVAGLLALGTAVVRRHEPTAGIRMMLAAILALTAWYVLGIAANPFGEGWRTAWLLLAAGGAAAIAAAGWLIPGPGARKPDCPASVAAGGFAVAAVVVAVLLDSRSNVLPALLVIAPVAVAGLAYLLKYQDPAKTGGNALVLGALFAFAFAVTNRWGLDSRVPVFVAVAGAAALGLGIASRRTPIVLGATLHIAAALAFLGFLTVTHQSVPISLTALMTAGLAIALTRAFGDRPDQGSTVSAPFLALATGVVLMSLTFGLLQGALVTASWGVVAVGLLLGGFAFRDRNWRWAAIAVFALSLCRVVLVDLGDSDVNARIIASLFIGGFMIASAYLYGMLSRRLLK